jgi:hypothetical protein
MTLFRMLALHRFHYPALMIYLRMKALMALSPYMMALVMVTTLRAILFAPALVFVFVYLERIGR